MHPYRKHRSTCREASPASEELIVYAALCVVGAIPIAVALGRGGAFGVEPTLGMLMALAGVAGVITTLLHLRQRR
jgi:hypothetical protein